MPAGHVICLTPPAPPAAIQQLLEARAKARAASREAPPLDPAELRRSPRGGRLHPAAPARGASPQREPAAARARELERRAAAQEFVEEGSSSGSELWEQESQDSDEGPGARRPQARASMSKPVVLTILLLNLAAMLGIAYNGLADVMTSSQPAGVRKARDDSGDGGHARGGVYLVTSGKAQRSEDVAVASEGPQRRPVAADLAGQPEGLAELSEGQAEGTTEEMKASAASPSERQSGKPTGREADAEEAPL
ncbi:unnamed protein product [Prorocentrum cordatum]|uniref:Uncharacterized protein n=1 Tax=Prorocentrum cordatum TaxID=2364126 RepID=A0ABN9W4Y1_9DINO|nr:unnamed protein product [Polarella glacialis]